MNEIRVRHLEATAFLFFLSLPFPLSSPLSPLLSSPSLPLTLSVLSLSIFLSLPPPLLTTPLPLFVSLPQLTSHLSVPLLRDDNRSRLSPFFLYSCSFYAGLGFRVCLLGATSTDAQELFMTLNSGTTPCGAQGSYGILGLSPGWPYARQRFYLLYFGSFLNVS